MSDERPEQEWMSALRGWAGGVRPTGDVYGPVAAGVRRRRRRHSSLVVAGAVAAVLVAALVLEPGLRGDRADPSPGPATSSPGASEGSREPFGCATESRVFGESPPIPDLEEQRETVTRLREMSSVQVRHAEPTALGVVALVVQPEPEVVERLRRAGAAHVSEWAPGFGGGEEQVDQVLQWQLQPALRQTRRAMRGIPGYASIALWPDAGALLLQWQAPVPPEVRALTGERADGVRIILEEVRYSAADVRQAQRSLQGWLRESGRRDEWASAYACADGAGLVVGMVPRVADDPGLADEIAAAVSMPVLVVSEERPVELGPGLLGR